MRKIGGMFHYEPSTPIENGYFSRICSPGDDLAFTMSGRCGIYYCLQEIACHDMRKVAYVPLYTCETVLAPFEKAGYQLKFYELDQDLHSIFDTSVIDEISVLSLCGYYGFCNYDHDFVKACKEKGVVIFEDVTHSMLSADGIDPLCDYFAGSFRKWMGIDCGGFAVKRNGTFETPLLQVEPTHLKQRKEYYETGDDDIFWEGELRLRQMFDCFAGDDNSEYILRHADFDSICRTRRENYAALLDALTAPLHGVQPVFPELPEATVPSHFCLYAENRDEFQQYLADHQIRSTVYWPVGPLVHPLPDSSEQYIYDHIVSVPCDQRFTPSDMQYVAQVLMDYSENFMR